MINDKEIETTKNEINKYVKMIDLLKELIEINLNKDKYGNKSPLSDFNSELTEQIKHHETAIKERLFILYKAGIPL